MLYKAIDKVNQIQPAFVIFLGDLVHAFPDKSEELFERQALQATDFKKAVDRIDRTIPVYYVSGNHDIGNKVDERGRRTYQERFGKDFFAFTAHGVRCVVLNTQAFFDPDARELASAQEKFLEENLEAGAINDDGTPKYKQRIVFGHISPFLFASDEPEAYFNLAPPIRSKLLGIAKNAGVRLWMAGHYHRNAGGIDGSLECVTSSALGTVLHPTGIDPLGLGGCGEKICNEAESGLRIVKVYEDKIAHEWFPVKDIPDSVSV